MQASGIKMGGALEQWYLLQYSVETDGVQEAMEALAPTSEFVKVIINFLQVAVSFGDTFAEILFPPEVQAFFSAFGFVNFDFLNLHWAAVVASGVTYPNTTLLIMVGFAAFLGSVLLSYKLFASCYSSEHRRQARALPRPQ